MDLQNISHIPNYGIELLEAIGCLHTRSLSRKKAEALFTDVIKANDLLKLTNEELSVEQVNDWIIQAQEIEGLENIDKEPSNDESNISNLTIFERHPQVITYLKNAPEAERLRGQLIKDAKLAVSDIPEGIMLDSCDESQVLRTPSGLFILNDIPVPERPSSGEIKEGFNDFDSFMSGETAVAPLERGEASESITMGEDLNENVSPSSRRYIKGVFHPQAGDLKLAAASFLFLNLVCVLSFLLILYVTILGDLTDGHAIAIFIVSLGVFVVALVTYLLLANKSNCKICGQKQFTPKRCIKHKKAHHIPIIGYMLPTALQMLIFHWFYCIYCGTAVRFKK